MTCLPYVVGLSSPTYLDISILSGAIVELTMSLLPFVLPFLERSLSTSFSIILQGVALAS